MKKIFATVSDKNYLIYGLTLYDSIKGFITSDFELKYLALDDETYEKIKGLENVKAYRLSDLQNNPKFHILMQKQSVPNGLSTFHFCLASFFCNHLINIEDIYLDHVLYVDADILFYRDPNEIFKSVDNYSVGLGTHKHIPLNKFVRNPGYFNVGTVFFKGNLLGKRCLSAWEHCVLDFENPKYHPFNACYDQKFLELFEDWVGKENVKILDYDVGHIAPWNMSMMRFHEAKMDWLDNEGYVLNKKQSFVQDIVFSHFAHFKPDYENNSYRVDREGEWGNIIGHDGVKEIYDDYFFKCKTTKEKYNL